jgi:hypothetical protein
VTVNPALSTAEEVADRILANIEQGLFYKGERVDRASVLEFVERAWPSGAQFDELLRDAAWDLNPELGEAKIEHLIAVREEVRLALLRRLRS